MSNSGSTLIDAVNAAYPAMAQLYASDWYVLQARNEGWYTLTGGVVSASATLGKVDLTAGTNFIGTTELVYGALSAQAALVTANSTTVASGSNGQHTNALTSNQLAGASAAGFPTSGTLLVYHTTATISVITYTNISSNTFTGCTLTNGTDVTLATGDTILGANCDGTNPKWAAIELTTTGTSGVNVGTAAANPEKPTPTTNRNVHAWLYIPANATAIDTLTSTANGNAKIIEARQLVADRPGRILFTGGDNGITAGSPSTWATNGTTLTSVLLATYSIPANSLQVGDQLVLEWAGFYTNNASASTLEMKLLIDAVTILDYTTASLATSANSRKFGARLTGVVRANGATSNWHVEGIYFMGAAQSTLIPIVPFETQEGYNSAGNFNNAAGANVLDLQVKLGTASAGATMNIRSFTLMKFPAL